MNIRRLLGAGVIWLGMSVPAIASLVIKNVEITSLPALYKSDSGLQQRVWINIVHEGDVEPIVLQLGEVTKKVKLHSGENNFYIEIPEVSQVQEDVLTVKQGREILYTEPIKINPVRHWQMNLVQHTHTDIGYTRSQMEILAEHLRYIDYALDYCDATDNYPEPAKFRWTCEISWAVSEYLKCRPAEQIARLKQSANISRIFSTLGADPHSLSYFWILPPLAGIIVQPIVGAASDRTWTRFGRRIPYLFIGSLVAVLVMCLLPNAGSFGMAVSTAMIFGLVSLMFLDTSINMAMQPFKMMVGDMVNEKQKGLAYSIQSSFVMQEVWQDICSVYLRGNRYQQYRPQGSRA